MPRRQPAILPQYIRSCIIRNTITNLKANYELDGYPAHRDRQRRRIIEAAAKLFDERGVDRVTMADITTASGVRASTLYQYFSKKDDIVWAMVSEIFGEATAQVNERMEGATTALAKITALLDYMADELAEDSARVRFMAQFDAMYARDWPAERLLTLEAQINPKGFRFFRNLIREGIADGSLNPELDPDLTLHAVINTVIGSQRRLASLGKKVELEYGQPIDRLFRETIRIILLGLRAQQSTTKTTTRKRSS
jgi:AcrR family transcriptional regulator